MLATYEFCVATREELHGLLKQFGGRGISHTLWKFLKSSTKIAHETSMVLDREELHMLMITNGCKKEITQYQWVCLHMYGDWNLDSVET